MGSVQDILTTGDNDEPIFPVTYYNYHMYCDDCGSFAIKDWMEPENFAELQRLVARLGQVRNLSVGAVFISACIALLEFPIFLGLSLVVLVAVVAAAAYFDSKIELRGVRCEQCGTRYAHGSRFFTDLPNNPMNFTMSDVPGPLYNVYQIRGDEIGPG